jgi:hypothetical protein
MTPVGQNQNEKQKVPLSGLGITKEVVGIHVLLTHSLFASDIPRGLLFRVSPTKSISQLCKAILCKHDIAHHKPLW